MKKKQKDFVSVKNELKAHVTNMNVWNRSYRISEE